MVPGIEEPSANGEINLPVDGEFFYARRYPTLVSTLDFHAATTSAAQRQQSPYARCFIAEAESF